MVQGLVPVLGQVGELGMQLQRARARARVLARAVVVVQAQELAWALALALALAQLLVLARQPLGAPLQLEHDCQRRTVCHSLGFAFDLHLDRGLADAFLAAVSLLCHRRRRCCCCCSCGGDALGAGARRARQLT